MEDMFWRDEETNKALLSYHSSSTWVLNCSLFCELGFARSVRCDLKSDVRR